MNANMVWLLQCETLFTVWNTSSWLYFSHLKILQSVSSAREKCGQLLLLLLAKSNANAETQWRHLQNLAQITWYGSHGSVLNLCKDYPIIFSAKDHLDKTYGFSIKSNMVESPVCRYSCWRVCWTRGKEFLGTSLLKTCFKSCECPSNSDPLECLKYRHENW